MPHQYEFIDQITDQSTKKKWEQLGHLSSTNTGDYISKFRLFSEEEKTETVPLM